MIALSKQSPFLDILFLLIFSFNKYWYRFIWYYQTSTECKVRFVFLGIFLNAFSSIITTWLKTGLSVSSLLILYWLSKSIIGDNYKFFPEILNSVISVAYFWFGASALQFLFKRLWAILPCSPFYNLYFFTLIKLFSPNSFNSLKTVLWLIIIT